MYQISIRDYNYKSKSKSMSKDDYNDVQKLYSQLFGKYAGWAQSVLFQREITVKKRKHE